LSLRCVRCGKTRGIDSGYVCECGGLLEVVHEFPRVDREVFDERLREWGPPWGSGVWRYKELVHPQIRVGHIVSRPEGNTNLYHRPQVSAYTGISQTFMKHEGENPTGSFKDRGMTVAVSQAKESNAKTVVCASTGNTSASVAAYAAQAGIPCVVFIPEGLVAYGKLAQALAYGARVLQVRGNFDQAMQLVREGAQELGYYILNSLNPWRLEGQKTIVFELIHQMGWEPPDWIVVPGGNLGNTAAFGKALRELRQLGLIDKTPRIATVQAEGANPFYRLFHEGHTLQPITPKTIASAINIGNPVNWEKALKSIKETGGVVEQVSDREILEAKAVIDSSGVGCEPASAASVAGARKLLERGVIEKDDEVVCILTGNLLKDPTTTIDFHMGKLYPSERQNKPTPIEASLEDLRRLLAGA